MTVVIMQMHNVMSQERERKVKQRFILWHINSGLIQEQDYFTRKHDNSIIQEQH